MCRSPPCSHLCLTLGCLLQVSSDFACILNFCTSSLGLAAYPLDRWKRFADREEAGFRSPLLHVTSSGTSEEASCRGSRLQASASRRARDREKLGEKERDAYPPTSPCVSLYSAVCVVYPPCLYRVERLLLFVCMMWSFFFLSFFSLSVLALLRYSARFLSCRSITKTFITPVPTLRVVRLQSSVQILSCMYTWRRNTGPHLEQQEEELYFLLLLRQ